MKNKKIPMLITLCLLCAVSLFSACKKDNTSEDTDAPVVTRAPISTPTTTPIELTLGIWPEASNANEVALFEGYTTEFASTHPDVTVVPAPYTFTVDNIKSLAEYDLLPVIFQTYYKAAGNVIEDGYVADITDILEERGWLDSMNPTVREFLSKDNRIYGIPCDAYGFGIMVNAALFKEAGVVDEAGLPVYPKTWSELAMTGKRIKDATGAAGFCLLGNDDAAGWQFMNIAWDYGATFLTENTDGSYTCNLDSPEAVAAMKYVKSLKWEYDILTADPTAEGYGTLFTQLGTGTAAMGIGANDVVAPAVSSGLAAEAVGLAPMPAGPDGQYTLFSGVPYMFSKSATREQINAALDYIEIMGKGPDAELLKIDSEVDRRLFEDYLEGVRQDGNLRLEEGGNALYHELATVIQVVIKDENADIASLMKTADENLQKLLDQ